MKSKKLNFIATHDNFNYFIVMVILVNSILIGVEISLKNLVIETAQTIILIIFLFELAIRFLGRESNVDYISDGWNWFDIFIVGVAITPITLLPKEVQGNQDFIAVFRIFRIFRIFRTFRAIKELRLISTVLIRSIQSLGVTALFFLIFMYAYAVIGVTLFQSDNYSETTNAKQYPTNPDPYGNLGEAFFTLFRILTGEDWTDLRYNLLKDTNYSNELVTFFHVSWVILASFLLINLVVGAVINNYNEAVSHQKNERNSNDHQNQPD